jgi:RNA polymerase sigma factor (sigma-70 family)
MNNNDEAFGEFINRLRNGTDDAANRVFSRYSRSLLNLARRHLEPALKRKIDADDVIQSVMRTFIGHCRAGDYDLVNWESIWGLLSLIVCRKCAAVANRYHSQKRDINKERSVHKRDENYEQDWEFSLAQPSVDSGLLLIETLEEMLTGLKPIDKQIVCRIVAGETVGQIADACNISRRTVERWRKKIKIWLLAHV